MRTLSNILALAASFIGLNAFAGGTGEIKGTVKSEAGEYLLTANVRITSNGSFIGGTITDINGMYTYKPLNPGSYEVEISYLGLTTQKTNNVVVSADQTTYVDATLKTPTKGVVIIEGEWNPPAIDKRFSTLDNIKADQIENMPDKKNIVSIISNVGTVLPTADGKDFHVRGSRRGANAYIVDGIRPLGGADVPSFAIANVALISGGVPAEYGDLSGGVVVITTKDFLFGSYEKKTMRKEYFKKNKASVDVPAESEGKLELTQ